MALTGQIGTPLTAKSHWVGHQFVNPLPHEDAKVVRGFGDKPVWIDQFERRLGLGVLGEVLERVPIVGVAVNQNGDFWVEGSCTGLCKGEHRVKRRLRTRSVVMFLQVGDEFREPLSHAGQRTGAGQSLLGCFNPGIPGTAAGALLGRVAIGRETSATRRESAAV